MEPLVLEDSDLPSVLAHVQQVALKAGELILGALHTNTDSNVHLKGRVDLVTDTGKL